MLSSGVAVVASVVSVAGAMAESLISTIDLSMVLATALMVAVMVGWFVAFAAVARALVPHPRETVVHGTATHREVTP